MELHKMIVEDFRKMDKAQLANTEADIRKELALLRVDVYTPKAQSQGQKLGLKRSLARLMTVKTETLKKK